MPTYKMKAKSITSYLREGSGLHVCRNSSIISKTASPPSHISPETSELATFIPKSPNGSGKAEVLCREVGFREASHPELDNGESGQKWFSFAEVTGSAERMECLSSTCSSYFETILSPIMESVIPFELSAQNGAGRKDEPIMLRATADYCDDGSSASSAYQTYDVQDFLLSDKSFTGLYTDGISSFGDTIQNDLLTDFEFADPKIMLDIADSSMMLPSLEETTETINTHHAGSYEELQKYADHSWFDQVSHQIKPNDQEQDDNTDNCNSDEADCSDPYLFLRNFPDLSDGGPNLLSALLSQDTRRRKHVTLVLDLDETLVHSTLEPCDNADFTIQVFFSMKEHTVYVRKRPFLVAFLKRVEEMFEIIIFTASQSIYAEQLLDKLDPDKKLFSQRAYRDSCVFSEGNYTKDLTVLGIDLAKVAIVDNSPQVFRLQVDNGIPIESWFDDPSDRALVTLLPFLETLVDVDDVRPIIAKKYSVTE